MKTTLKFLLPCLLVLFAATPPTQAQMFGTQKVVTTNADAPYSVFAADLDGDGDMDLVSVHTIIDFSVFSSKIAWYENLGNGNFSTQKIITTNTGAAYSVFAADLNGDGDIDLASASGNKIAWYENLGGGNFSAKKIITTNADGAQSVFAADLNGDGNIDLASASGWDDKIAWYENQGGGNFSNQKIITTNADGANSVFAADLNGDGDIDLASASTLDDKIAWYENLGGGNFSTQKIVNSPDTDGNSFNNVNGDADGARSVFAADLNGDGEIDLASASREDDKIAWYENLGGGNFSAQKIIATNAYRAYSVFAADLNGDGDIDLASALANDDKIAWYENLGGGNFSMQQVVTSNADGANSVYAADLDGDGDMDLASASQYDYKIAWYENLSINNYNKVSGRLVADLNGNCEYEIGQDSILPIQFIKSKTDAQYAFYDDSAKTYELLFKSGDFEFQPVIPNRLKPLIQQTCPANAHSITFTGTKKDTSGFNFYYKTNNCHFLTVAVGSDRRRRCMESRTTISYKNEGIATAPNAKVYVQMPEFVKVVSADKSFTYQNDSTLVFEVGDLAPNQDGTIRLTDKVVCGIEAIRGITQCTKAWMTPVENCTQPEPNYTGSDLEIRSRCEGDGAFSIIIKNTGNGDMTDSSLVSVFYSKKLVRQYKLKLAAGDSVEMVAPFRGRSLRVEVDQEPLHPNNEPLALTLENCGNKVVKDEDKGIGTTFPVYDKAPEVAEDCQVIRDSYDPNDKRATPAGILAQNYTPTDADLHYRIRFQNTGNDTAYKVVVVDSLSPYLDPATLQMGAVSHAYKLEISGKGSPVLKFIFNDIMLVDSTTNEPLSHGHIFFKIAPYDTLTPGFVVNNRADIYFDFNSAILTNTTMNTIYDTVPPLPQAELAEIQAMAADITVGTGLITSQKLKAQIAGLQIWPNPNSGLFTVSATDRIAQIQVMDLVGRTVINKTVNQPQAQINLSSHGKGVYLIKVTGQNGYTSMKRVVVQ